MRPIQNLYTEAMREAGLAPQPAQSPTAPPSPPPARRTRMPTVTVQTPTPAPAGARPKRPRWNRFPETDWKDERQCNLRKCTASATISSWSTASAKTAMRCLREAQRRAVLLCDRKFGVGGDGVIALLPGQYAPFADADVQPGRLRVRDVRQRHSLLRQVSL